MFVLLLLLAPLFNGGMGAFSPELQTKFVDAVSRDDAMTAQECIYKGADPNAMNLRTLETPVFIAVTNNALVTLSTLVQNGAYLDQRMRTSTILHRVVQSNLYYSAHAMLYLGASTAVIDEDSLTPLHIAAKTNEVQMIKLLVHFNAAVNQKTYEGKTAMHFAAQNDCREAVYALIELGGNMETWDNTFNSPLDYAKRISAELYDKMNYMKTHPVPPTPFNSRKLLDDGNDGLGEESYHHIPGLLDERAERMRMLVTGLAEKFGRSRNDVYKLLRATYCPRKKLAT